MRSVPEWRGKTDDAKIPPRVRLRVFSKYEGRCYLSGRKIMPGDKWECEHVIALANGGSHAEGNLAPALVAPHKDKTRADRREQKRITDKRKSHLGIRKPRTIRGWRRFDGTVVYADRER